MVAPESLDRRLPSAQRRDNHSTFSMPSTSKGLSSGSPVNSTAWCSWATTTANASANEIAYRALSRAAKKDDAPTASLT